MTAEIPTSPLVPNEAVAVANGYISQADIDQYDWLIIQLGLAGYGVISGCVVTAQASPDMTVAVTEGFVRAGAQQVYVPAQSSAAFSSSGGAGTTKYAFVEIDPTKNPGSRVVRNVGTAATSPIFPPPGSGNVVLTAITIPQGVTSIAAGQLVTKRVLLDAGYSTAAKVSLSSFDSTRSRP